jgi:hypothetical protein
MGKTITKFRWFWAWQDETEERWLGEMSKKGYHLLSVGIPGIYTFSVAEPREYVYRLDFQNFTRKDKQEYLQLFRDAGWEHIGELSTWQYFRKEVKEGEVNEIFTDAESKIAKYKRALVFMGFMFVLLSFILSWRILAQHPYAWWDGIRIVYLLIISFVVFSIVKIALRIRQLKRR